MNPHVIMENIIMFFADKSDASSHFYEVLLQIIVIFAKQKNIRVVIKYYRENAACIKSQKCDQQIIIRWRLHFVDTPCMSTIREESPGTSQIAKRKEENFITDGQQQIYHGISFWFQSRICCFATTTVVAENRCNRKRNLKHPKPLWCTWRCDKCWDRKSLLHTFFPFLCLLSITKITCLLLKLLDTNNVQKLCNLGLQNSLLCLLLLRLIFTAFTDVRNQVKFMGSFFEKVALSLNCYLHCLLQFFYSFF